MEHEFGNTIVQSYPVARSLSGQPSSGVEYSQGFGFALMDQVNLIKNKIVALPTSTKIMIGAGVIAAIVLGLYLIRRGVIKRVLGNPPFVAAAIQGAKGARERAAKKTERRDF